LEEAMSDEAVISAIEQSRKVLEQKELHTRLLLEQLYEQAGFMKPRTENYQSLTETRRAVMERWAEHAKLARAEGLNAAANYCERKANGR